METQTQEELTNLLELEEAGTLEETQQNRLNELKSWADAEKSAGKAKEIEEKNKQLFERTKKAEDKAKLAEEELAKVKGEPRKELDPTEIADVSLALSGLDPDEQAKLIRDAKAFGKPLSEIRKSEDFVLWQGAHKEKVEKEKTTPPSTKQTASDTREDRIRRFKSGEMTEEEEQKFLQELGTLRKFGPPTPLKRE